MKQQPPQPVQIVAPNRPADNSIGQQVPQTLGSFSKTSVNLGDTIINIPDRGVVCSIQVPPFLRRRKVYAMAQLLPLAGAMPDNTPAAFYATVRCYKDSTPVYDLPLEVLASAENRVGLPGTNNSLCSAFLGTTVAPTTDGLLVYTWTNYAIDQGAQVVLNPTCFDAEISSIQLIVNNVVFVRQANLFLACRSEFIAPF